jgi:hypothetical protein
MTTPSSRLAFLLLLFSFDATHAQAPADVWQPIHRLVGDWSGTSIGQAGGGTVTRRYTWVMNERYLNETNVSVYPPQEKNEKGERHEHWGMFSYDKTRNLLVLRQFHVESFVTTYRLASSEDDKMVFESESFENFSNSWRARETYEFISKDEFVESFELAAPGKNFLLYSRTHLKRVAQ